MYLCQEGGGEGGEKEHIYNHPKGGLVPPPKEGLWGVGVLGYGFFFFSGVLNLTLKLAQCVRAVLVSFCQGGSGLWFDCFHSALDHPAMVS